MPVDVDNRLMVFGLVCRAAVFHQNGAKVVTDSVEGGGQHADGSCDSSHQNGFDLQRAQGLIQVRFVEGTETPFR